MGAMSTEVELAFLKQHAELLAGRVEAINKRIQQLEEEEQ